MKKQFVLLFIATLSVIAGQPGWTVNPSDYLYSSTVTAVLVANDTVAQSGNTIVAFSGSEVRGVANPINVSGTWMYFLTIYSNSGSGETMNFKAYITSVDDVVDINETIPFTANTVTGNPVTPYEFHAVVNYDHAPVVKNIPDEIIDQGGNFPVLHLVNYLTEFDGDAITWKVSGNALLQVAIDPVTLDVTVTPPPGFAGSEKIIFTAIDITQHKYSGSDTALYTVRPFDYPPQVEDIQNQTKGINGVFQDVPLDDYVTLQDQNSVAWSYKVQTQFVGTPRPAWSVTPTSYQFSMNLTAKVFSRSTLLQNGNHVLAAFAGNELRGVTQGSVVGDSMLFFLTIYSNTSDEQLHFSIFDDTTKELLPVYEKLTFTANSIIGAPAQPFDLHAGNIVFLINSQHMLHVAAVDSTWIGSEHVTFIATDMGTNHAYSDSDSAVFTIVAEHAPILVGIPDQASEGGNSFTVFDLDNYLTEYDGDAVTYSYSGNSHLSLSINGAHQVTVTSLTPNWLGSETIYFTVTDNTTNGFTSTDTVTFSVEEADHPPTLGNIPNQTIGLLGSFLPVDLGIYLHEADGDSIAWSYTYLSTPRGRPVPSWSVTPSLYQFSMNMTASITSRNKQVNSGSYRLAAFIGNEVRGVTSPVKVENRWMFFMTIYSNSIGEQVRFKLYDATLQDTVPVKERIEFVANGILGTPEQPVPMNAGNILLTVDALNHVSFETVDSSWVGSETIYYTAADANRSHHYSATDVAIYSVLSDRSPIVEGIPDQTVQQGKPFAMFDLDDFLKEFDGQQVRWGASTSQNYTVSINNNNQVTVTPKSQSWMGSEDIVFKVSDISQYELFNLDTVRFSVIGLNHRPIILNTLSQEISPSDSFATFDLDNYLNDQDQDSVTWTYNFIQPQSPDPQPGWVITPSSYQYSMTLTAKVTSLSTVCDGSGSMLAAFSGNELRGVTNAVQVGTSWVYFLTVYANGDGETIRFKFYDARAQRILPVKQSLTFSSNAVYGNPLNPYFVDAGNLLVRMNEGNIITIERTVPSWLGTEFLTFVAKEKNTPDLYTDTAVSHFSVIQNAFGNSITNIVLGDLPVMTTKQDTIHITNQGKGNLVITSVIIDNTDYTVTPMNATIAEGAGQDFILTFTPTSSGSKDAHLTFVHNAYQSPRIITLQGSGQFLTMSASKTGNGSITPIGANNIAYGNDQGYVITPDRGYKTDSVVVDGTDNGKLTSYNFTHIVSSHTIAAYFSIIPSYGVKYRTATMEDWATAVNSQGQRKANKRAYDKVFFDFDLLTDATRLLHLTFSMETKGVITTGSTPLDTLASFTGNNVDLDLSALITPGQTVHVTGIGLIGRNITTKYAWGNSVLKPMLHNQYKRINLGIALPNLNNVGIEMFGIGRHGAFPKGLRIGIEQGARGGGSVNHYKYKDVLKSLATLTPRGFVLHSAGPRCLDRLESGDSMTTRERSLPVERQNNKLFAEALALKLNVNASKIGKFPIGLGELTYYDTLNGNDNPFNGMLVKQISTKADTMLSCIPLSGAPTATFSDLYEVMRAINGSFRTDGTLDTISFFKTTRLNGALPLVSVNFLKTTPGMTPAIIELDESENEVMEEEEIPEGYGLAQNYPNPFNPSTMISFDLPEASVVTLKVYNVLGQEIGTLLNHEVMDEGTQEVPFNGSELSSGVYFYRLSVTNQNDVTIFSDFKRMVLMK